MSNNHPGRVEDYTTACLVMAFVNLCALFVIVWSYFGPGAVLVLAAVFNHAISRLGRMRRRRLRAAIRRGRDPTHTP